MRECSRTLRGDCLGGAARLGNMREFNGFPQEGREGITPGHALADLRTFRAALERQWP